MIWKAFVKANFVFTNDHWQMTIDFFAVQMYVFENNFFGDFLRLNFVR